MVREGGRGGGGRGGRDGRVRWRGRRGSLWRSGWGAGTAFGFCPLLFAGRTVLVEVQCSKSLSDGRCND